MREKSMAKHQNQHRLAYNESAVYRCDTCRLFFDNLSDERQHHHLKHAEIARDTDLFSKRQRMEKTVPPPLFENEGDPTENEYVMEANTTAIPVGDHVVFSLSCFS
jgi:hypothetical protein